MKEKDILSKWLDNDLNEQELEAFKQLDASGSLHKLDAAAKLYKAPNFDVPESYARLQEAKKAKQAVKRFTLRQFVASAAAVILIAFGLYAAFFTSDLTMHEAAMGHHTSLTLPDSSEVILNAGSQLSFDEDNWQNDRSLSLEGEAYFKVSKGETFTVATTQGTVAVKGTQFNVKSRNDYFEVTCFEGAVEVVYNKKTYQLPAGTNFRVTNGVLSEFSTQAGIPSWIENKSVFKSVPYGQVLEELERQYSIQFVTKEIDKNVIFTGSFTHEDLETALKAITLPLLLTYEIDETLVTLKK